MVRRIFILPLLLLLLTPFIPLSFAQTPPAIENEIQTQTEPGSEEAEGADILVEEDVEYELPYPGMLPDNPLYFLKTFRDAIVKLLAQDSLKEAEFNILTANKRAYAALLLSEKGNHELALETLSKSTNYLHEATVSLTKAKEERMEIAPILDSAKKSVKKHRQIFSRQIVPNTPQQMKADLEREIERLKPIEEAVENLASN